MTPLPTLPTDSLYKFLFYFGLILTLGGFYFQYKNQNVRLHYHEQIDSLSIRHLSLTEYQIKRQGRINVEVEKTNKAYDRLIEASKSKVHINVDSLADRVVINGLNARLEEVKKNAYRDSIETVFHAQVNYLERKIKHIDSGSDTFIAFSSLIAGLVLTFGSGMLWYKKIQIHADKLLELQVNTALKEAARPTVSGRKHFGPVSLPRNRS